MSTPSLASYHLAKLVDAKRVRQDELGRYEVTEDAVGEILAGYSKIGVAIVPQLFFFALLFTILTCFFSVEVLFFGNYVFFLVGASLAMVVVLWLETWRLWKKLVE